MVAFQPTRVASGLAFRFFRGDPGQEPAWAALCQDGPRTQPTERIDFVELSDPPHSGEFLWGSGAVVVTALLCRAFAQHGWDLAPGLAGELDRLPLHVHTVGGESVVTPLTEIELSERAGEMLADRGMMSLFAVRGTDRVGMGTLRSISGAPLRGRWPAT